MKVLFLMSQLPYPPDTGAKIRTFNLIKRLSLNHDIDLVTFGDEKTELFKIKAIKELFGEIILIPRNRFMCIKMFFNIFSFLPYAIKKYYSKKMEKTINALIGQNRYDLIHCDSLQMSRNVLKFKQIPRILTEHNIESQILKRCAENEHNVFKKLYYYLQYKKLNRYEIFACRQFDHIAAVSENDKRHLATFVPADRISVVPNGVDTGHFRPEACESKAKTGKFSLVFTGSMDWLPNEDALCYFFSEIYPRIKQSVGRVSMSVVGRSPTRRILAYADNDSSIHITGRVEDVRPFISQADIFVTPLRIGGGTRLKILEAMAMAKPVVSTTIGAEGLEVEPEKNIILSDRPEDFAERVIKLFGDQQLKNNIAAEGRKLAEEKYDWSMIAGKLERIWKNTGQKELSIFLYHDIRDDNFDLSSVGAELIPYILKKSDFIEQMEWLAENGRGSTSKSVKIVFDDGWRSNYEIAYPILKKLGFAATFFVTIGNIGKPEMMTWDELKELADNGMTIGSHNMTHRPPVEFSDEEIEYEMKESKRILEEKLERPVDAFSSPTGFYDKRIISIARKVGYAEVYFSKVALSEIGGSNNPIVFSKIGIKRGCDLKAFKGIVRGDKRILAWLRLKQIVRDMAKSLLGSRKYIQLKSFVLKKTREIG